MSAEVTRFAAADAAVIDRLLDVAGGHAADHSARIVRDVMLITDVALALFLAPGGSVQKKPRRECCCIIMAVYRDVRFLIVRFKDERDIYQRRAGSSAAFIRSEAVDPSTRQLRAQHVPSTRRAAWATAQHRASEVVDERDDATVVSGSKSPGTLTEVPGGAV